MRPRPWEPRWGELREDAEARREGERWMRLAMDRIRKELVTCRRRGQLPP